MDGFGQVSELPAELEDGVSGVMIFHGNPAPDDAEGGGAGLWTELRPGHGWGFSSDGAANTYGPRFGVELTFAHRLQRKAYNRPQLIGVAFSIQEAPNVPSDHWDVPLDAILTECGRTLFRKGA